jgi:hypothetical protein
MKNFIQIPDQVIDQILDIGLSKSEVKLFFYFAKLDRFGDRPAEINIPELILNLGISKASFYRCIAKFQELGWFDFQCKSMKVRNNLKGQINYQNESQICDKNSQKLENESQICDKNSQKLENESQICDKNSQKLENETPEPIKINSPVIAHTNSDFSDKSKPLSDYREFLKTLDGQERENFERFCRDTINKLSFKVENQGAWLNKYFLGYWDDFKNQQPRNEYKPPIKRDLDDLYRSGYRNYNDLIEPAGYYGYSEEEVQFYLNQKSS